MLVLFYLKRRIRAIIYELQSLFWNVCGLNDPDKHKPFIDWSAQSKATFGAILETHIKELQLNHVMSRTCSNWRYFSNHTADPGGRVIIIWKAPASPRLLHQTRQSLTCEISIGGAFKFIMTAIYASNLHAERTDLWVDLLNIQQLFSLDSVPWIIGGDFNQILHFSEHSNASVNCYDPPMTMFRDTLSDLGIFDLRYNGPLFTWSKKTPLVQ